MKSGIDFIARMVVEWLDLLDKTIKLENFMDTHLLWKRTDYQEMITQRNAMEQYALALAMRLVNLGIDLNELLNNYSVSGSYAYLIAREAKEKCRKKRAEENENADNHGD